MSTLNTLVVNKLQRQINTLLPWLDEWKISANTLKTKAVMFSHKSMAITHMLKKHTNIYMINAIKYLGVNIDKKLYFVKSVNYSIGKATAVKMKIHPSINSKSPLTLHTKYIYKAYIEQIYYIFTYAEPT